MVTISLMGMGVVTVSSIDKMSKWVDEWMVGCTIGWMSEFRERGRGDASEWHLERARCIYCSALLAAFDLGMSRALAPLDRNSGSQLWIATRDHKTGS